jgi:hypothetical protein
MIVWENENSVERIWRENSSINFNIYWKNNSEVSSYSVFFVNVKWLIEFRFESKYSKKGKGILQAYTISYYVTNIFWQSEVAAQSYHSSIFLMNKYYLY